jgi:cardiolipin synthase
MKYKMVWNIPNILSLSRLVFTPVIIFFLVLISKEVFALIFFLFQLTDVLDGFIAKRFNMQTEIGCLLDTWGDFCSYVIAISALLHYFPRFFIDWNFILLVIFVCLYLLNAILIKVLKNEIAFGLPSFLSKITFYLQSSFLIFSFTCYLLPWFYYLAFLVGVLRELQNTYLILNKKI